MAGKQWDRVMRRRVFYIPGYDPFPPRRYRELYRKEGAEQARISGYTLSQSPGQSAKTFGWHAEMEESGVRSQAEIDVLVWSDIVGASMGHSIPATYWQLLKTAWVYISTGALFRLARLRKGPTIAALYPIGALILQLAAAVLVFYLAGWGVGWSFSLVERMVWPGRIFTPLFLPSIYVSLLLGVAAAIFALVWFKRHDNRIFAYYLMHDYAFTASARGAHPAALAPRMAEFGAHIGEALSEDWDEVLVVGHSSGAHLAISILADLIRAGKLRKDGPALGFLSLGQVVPMVSFLPEARKLRGDLAFLSACEDLTWVDVTAPGDGCAYALCDPVAVTGVAPPGKRWPLVVSAAFTQTLSPQRWAELRWRFFRLHFQYLCAFDRPGDYDYFRITAGAVTLSERYRARIPSKSRIEAGTNRYRDVE
jgi:hypothetical protein